MRKPKPPPQSKASKVAEIVFNVILFVVLSCAWAGGIWYFIDVIARAFTSNHRAEVSTERPHTAGELVDKAMAIPGAIIISPQTDLIEMGIAKITDNPTGCAMSLKVGSPSIAVHTKHKWCIWELGETSLLEYHDDKHCNGPAITGNVFGENDTFIGSAEGYQSGYDLFNKCISEGNTIDPRKDHGAICDGNMSRKPDDTDALNASMKEAETLYSGRVSLPNGCVVHGLELPDDPSPPVDGPVRRRHRHMFKASPYHCGEQVCAHGDTLISFMDGPRQCVCY